MNRVRVRRAAISVVGVVSLALLATACPTPPSYNGPPTGNRSFSATSVTVNSSNDYIWLVNPAKDEPKVLNIGFRATLGGGDGTHTPNATAQVIAGDNHWPGLTNQGPSEGETHNYCAECTVYDSADLLHLFPITVKEQGTVNFNNVKLPDLVDIVRGAKPEIAGVWAWKVEDDGPLSANITAIADAVAAAMVTALNSTVGTASVPTDANQLVTSITDAILNMGFLNLLEVGIVAAMANLNIAVDDVMGSAMYIGIGSSGTLGSAIDTAFANVNIPPIALDNIPILGNITVPPDIGGGKIFSLRSAKTFTNNFTNPGVDGQHTTTYTFG